MKAFAGEAPASETGAKSRAGLFLKQVATLHGFDSFQARWQVVQPVVVKLKP